MKLELNALELQQTIVDDKISKIEKSGKKVQNLYNIYQNSYPAMSDISKDIPTFQSIRLGIAQAYKVSF